MKYRGYSAKCEFDQEANIYHGAVTNTKDTITFQSKKREGLEKEFQLSVDEYIEFKNKLSSEGKLKGSIEYEGDIVSQLENKWGACRDWDNKE